MAPTRIWRESDPQKKKKPFLLSQRMSRRLQPPSRGDSREQLPAWGSLAAAHPRWQEQRAPVIGQSWDRRSRGRQQTAAGNPPSQLAGPLSRLALVSARRSSRNMRRTPGATGTGLLPPSPGEPSWPLPAGSSSCIKHHAGWSRLI